MVIAERRGSIAIIDDIALRAFARGFGGNVIQPGDPRYEAERKVFNASIDRRPALIVQPADAADVVRALAFAREHDLPLAVRGGGHSTPGYGIVDDGMVIDLALRKSVEVDPVARVARAGAGLRAGEYVPQTEPFGLVSPVGDAVHTGLAGLTLGGGYGWLSGKRGLITDNLLAAEIVTADGRILRASSEEHSDLFWALRGGTGNFGVVTTFEFHLEPQPAVLGGMLVYPFPMARDLLRFHREFVANAPDELTTYFALATMPDGMPVAGVMLCYSGEDLAEGERAIAPLRAFGPVADMIQPMPYSGMAHLTDPFAPEGMHREERWINQPELDDATIDALIELSDPRQSLGGTLIVKQLNGAATRVHPAATAFPHRYPHFSIVPLAAWVPPAEAEPRIAWVEKVAETVRPFSTGVYVNGAEHESVATVYGGNYERLAAVKAVYDPENLFRHNYNITPANA
jgi:hypothetical protein